MKNRVDWGFEDIPCAPEKEIVKGEGEEYCPECGKPTTIINFIQIHSGEKICPACYRRHVAAIEED